MHYVLTTSQLSVVKQQLRSAWANVIKIAGGKLIRSAMQQGHRSACRPRRTSARRASASVNVQDWKRRKFLLWTVNLSSASGVSSVIWSGNTFSYILFYAVNVLLSRNIDWKFKFKRVSELGRRGIKEWFNAFCIHATFATVVLRFEPAPNCVINVCVVDLFMSNLRSALKSDCIGKTKKNTNASNVRLKNHFLWPCANFAKRSQVQWDLFH